MWVSSNLIGWVEDFNLKFCRKLKWKNEKKDTFYVHTYTSAANDDGMKERWCVPEIHRVTKSNCDFWILLLILVFIDLWLWTFFFLVCLCEIIPEIRRLTAIMHSIIHLMRWVFASVHLMHWIMCFIEGLVGTQAKAYFTYKSCDLVSLRWTFSIN